MTGYTTAFTVTTYPVSDGAVTIILDEDPVLVEEAESKRAYLPLIVKATS